MKYIRIAVALIVLMCAFVGCTDLPDGNEETEIYLQNITAFFSALDKGDAGEIKALFSQTAISTDSDLNEQIDKLISIYPRSTTTIMFDGSSLGSQYEQDEGISRSAAFTTFPVVSDNNYYWVYMELVYEDEFSSDNVGFNRVFFYTADEYCIFFNDDEAKYPLESGLIVYAQQNLEAEVRCINRQPYEFTPIERDLKLTEIEDFLKSGTSLADFTSTFGQPNAGYLSGAHRYDYYEIKESGGSLVYLKIGSQNGEIYSASIVDDFNYIRGISIDNE